MLGLGNIGSAAALSVMEGKAALFKRFGGVDAWPVVLDTQDTEEIIQIVKAIAPAYGGSHEAYVEGITGMAPTDESVEALIRILQELLKDPGRLVWMGSRAAEWARQAYDPERYAHLAVRRLL